MPNRKAWWLHRLYLPSYWLETWGHANVSDVLCDVRVILEPLYNCHGYQQQPLCRWSSWINQCGFFSDSYLTVSASPLWIILTGHSNSQHLPKTALLHLKYHSENIGSWRWRYCCEKILNLKWFYKFYKLEFIVNRTSFNCISRSPTANGRKNSKIKNGHRSVK